MKTTTLITKKEIKIKSGTVIQGLTPNDEPIEYDIYVPKGSKLKEIESGNISTTITTYPIKGNCLTVPCVYEIFNFIRKKAIKDGSKQIVIKNNKKPFKMFSVIVENGVIQKESNYITYFEAENIEEAKVLAKKYAEKNGLDSNFIVRL